MIFCFVAAALNQRVAFRPSVPDHKALWRFEVNAECYPALVARGKAACQTGAAFIGKANAIALWNQRSWGTEIVRIQSNH